MTILVLDGLLIILDVVLTDPSLSHLLSCFFHTHPAPAHTHNLGDGVILDRSVYSDSVFANVCKNEGFISEDGESDSFSLSFSSLSS